MRFTSTAQLLDHLHILEKEGYLIQSRITKATDDGKLLNFPLWTIGKDWNRNE